MAFKMKVFSGYGDGDSQPAQQQQQQKGIPSTSLAPAPCSNIMATQLSKPRSCFLSQLQQFPSHSMHFDVEVGGKCRKMEESLAGGLGCSMTWHFLFPTRHTTKRHFLLMPSNKRERWRNGERIKTPFK